MIALLKPKLREKIVHQIASRHRQHKNDEEETHGQQHFCDFGIRLTGTLLIETVRHLFPRLPCRSQFDYDDDGTDGDDDDCRGHENSSGNADNMFGNVRMKGVVWHVCDGGVGGGFYCPV